MRAGDAAGGEGAREGSGNGGGAVWEATLLSLVRSVSDARHSYALAVEHRVDLERQLDDFVELWDEMLGHTRVGEILFAMGGTDTSIYVGLDDGERFFYDGVVQDKMLLERARARELGMMVKLSRTKMLLERARARE